MEMKQDHAVRIIFLKRFTKEIITTKYKEQLSKENITIEKLKQKFPSSEEAFKKILRTPTNPPTQNKYQPTQVHPEIKQKPFIHNIIIPQKPTPIQPPQTPLIKKPIQQIVSEKKQILDQIQPVPEPEPQGFNLSKIDPLIKDNSIQLIECPGPGKNILIKRYNQINLTRITLDQTEISSIINAFSIQARIPMVGGILKAAVGNLIISAVISEFVGSRFIINKITPFSIAAGQ
jgi:hypothetical protein